MGCGCQQRADVVARQLHEHPHRTAAIVLLASVATGAALWVAEYLIIGREQRDPPPSWIRTHGQV
jgi:hypothetical protein